MKWEATRESEGRRDRVLSGTIWNLAETTAWMVQTLCRISRALDYAPDFVDDLEILGERIARGVPGEGMELHKLGACGVTGTTIRRLVETGYHSLSRILDTPAAEFKGVINPGIAQRIHEAIVKSFEESQKKAKRTQAYHMERVGGDPRIITAIYDRTGTDLEEAILDLLNAPPLELGAERIKTQRRGDPDFRLLLAGALLVWSVTARTKKDKDGAEN